MTVSKEDTSKEPWFLRSGCLRLMIGICPHCKIKLKELPVNNRETNEAMVVLTYRRIIEAGANIEGIKELGYCKVCRATIKDVEEQKRILSVPS